MDRELTPLEKSVLRKILSLPTETSETLTVQIDTARVTGRCDCGCPTIYLATASAGIEEIYVVEGAYRDDSPADVHLFTKEGQLATVEYVPYGDSSPTQFPDPAVMEVAKRPH